MRQSNANLLSGIPLCLSAMLVVQPAARADVAVEAHLQVLGAPEPAKTETRHVRLLNITPSILAFLLDHEHQKEPVIFATSRANSLALPDLPSGPLPAGFTFSPLPPGVEIAEVQDELSPLVLRGNPRDLDAAEKIIEAVDKPLQQAEVEVQMMGVSPAALQVLGAPQDASGPHLLATDIAAKMRSVLVDNSAKIVSAPRVTAIAGLVANLTSTTSVPLEVPSLGGYRHQDGSPAMPSSLPAKVWILQSIGFAVRPMVRAEGDIDLEMAAGLSWQVQTAEGAPATLRPGQRFSLRVLDGRSYLLYANPGFAPSVPKAEPAKAAQPEADGKIPVYIVRAHVLKRDGIVNDAVPMLVVGK